MLTNLRQQKYTLRLIRENTQTSKLLKHQTYRSQRPQSCQSSSNQGIRPPGGVTARLDNDDGVHTPVPTLRSLGIT